MAARLRFSIVESIAFACDQCLDHGVAGAARLHDDLARLFRPAGAARDLGDLLEGAFGGAQVPAFQPKIGVDDAHQRQIREMIAFGHQLRADDDVYRAGLHAGDELGGMGRVGDGIRRGDHATCLGKERLHLFADPLHAGAAGHEAVRLSAFGAFFRQFFQMPAMVAGQTPGQAMFDHPAGAIGALNPVPAMTAQRERGIAASVEKKQRLLAAFQPFLDRTHQCRRDPAAAFRRVLQQIERLDVGHLGLAEARGDDELLIAPDLRHVPRFQRGCGRCQNDRQAFHQAAHHRHISRMIAHAILLLETGLMRFIHDDAAQIGIGQEERGPRTDYDLRAAIGHAAPGPAALGGAHGTVPQGRLHPEPRLEPLEEGLGEGDFR